MPAIVDTGPLVAFFDRAERHDRRAIERIEESEAPLLVCEPMLAETMYLLGGHAEAQDALWEMHERHAVMTLDSDFSIYRKHGRTPLALIQPDGLPS